MKDWVELINKIKILEQTFQTMRPGSRGPLVKQAQALLGMPDADQTSVFDEKTRQAVISFQRQQKLNPDGIIGPQTWGRLSAGTATTTATAPTAPTTPSTDARKEPGFIQNTNNVAKSLGIDPMNLMTVFKQESSFNPQARNPNGATGLIQFMPNTAIGLGTTVDELYNMTGNQQLEYVQKFYSRFKGRLQTLGDLYLATFIPATVGRPDDFVLGVKRGVTGPNGEQSNEVLFKSFSRGELYRQNPGFDLNKDGVFTVGDVREKIVQQKETLAKSVAKQRGMA